MRYTIDNLRRSFLSNVVKHIAMIPAFITCLAATIFITGAAQAQDVSATIVNVQRFASGSQPTQLLATVTLEDVLIDGRRLGRQRVTFSLTGTQRDVQLAIGIHEGDTVERIDAQVTPVSLSVSGLKTFYISYLNQSALGRFTSTLTDSDRQIVFSICKFLTVRRNISSILQMLMTENNQSKPPNYIPTRMFFEASTFNVLISELVFIANRCVDEITSPIINRTVDTSSTVRPATPQAVSEVVDSSILAAVPSLNDAIRDIQSLINNSVSLEVHNELQAQLQAVQQELAALRRSTVPRSQYEQLQASTVSRQVHDRLAQQLSNVQNEIAALRGSTVSTDELARVERQLADAEAEITRLNQETVRQSEWEASQRRVEELERQLAIAPSSRQNSYEQQDAEPTRIKINVANCDSSTDRMTLQVSHVSGDPIRIIGEFLIADQNGIQLISTQLVMNLDSGQARNWPLLVDCNDARKLAYVDRSEQSAEIEFTSALSAMSWVEENEVTRPSQHSSTSPQRGTPGTKAFCNNDEFSMMFEAAKRVQLVPNSLNFGNAISCGVGSPLFDFASALLQGSTGSNILRIEFSGNRTLAGVLDFAFEGMVFGAALDLGGPAVCYDFLEQRLKRGRGFFCEGQAQQQQGGTGSQPFSSPSIRIPDPLNLRRYLDSN